MRDLINDGGDCRIAPATLGLLNRVVKYGSEDSKSRNTSKLHDPLKVYLGESAREGSRLLMLMTGGR